MSEIEKHINLSGRMSALAALVTPGHRLADVGCDHGYIPIYLCQAGRIPSAIAMDINPGPLSRAKDHIADCGLCEQIQIRQSDGLKELEEGEADTVLIAGMGGFLMRRILCEEEAVPESVSELVLQPQSDICEVRRCVRELAFVIVDEDMVEEDGKFYPMMKAKRGRKLCDRAEPSPCEDFFGPILLQKRHPVLKRWLEKEKMTAETILNQLDAACAGRMPDDRPDRMPVDRLILRRNEILQRRELLLYALNYYR